MRGVYNVKTVILFASTQEAGLAATSCNKVNAS